MEVLMPIDWIISENTVVQPDVSVIDQPVKENYLTFPPVIIFEILSPSTQKKDQGLKFELYQGEGVKYYIIVDPMNRSAKSYRLENKEYCLISDSGDAVIELESGSVRVPFDMGEIWGSFARLI